MREQQSLCNANVVLIEDKASGTQLIQELIVDDCHGITRYKPVGDKIMRLNAQTATIENGFVHLPEAAPWLAEYLHELTVFPRGKHDDQVDSTAQFLDWFKTPIASWGIYELTRRRAEALEARVEAHVFIAFLAYCLHVTLARRLHTLAPGLTPRSVLEKFAAVQMIDVHLPTTDGRELVLTRYTEPEPELSLLLKKLKLELPAQPPPKITATAPVPPTPL